MAGTNLYIASRTHPQIGAMSKTSLPINVRASYDMLAAFNQFTVRYADISALVTNNKNEIILTVNPRRDAIKELKGDAIPTTPAVSATFVKENIDDFKSSNSTVVSYFVENLRKPSNQPESKPLPYPFSYEKHVLLLVSD